MGQDPYIKKGIDTMNTVGFLMNAPTIHDLAIRLEILNKINAPFYASDIGISGGMVNSLRYHGIIEEVPCMMKEGFICVDEDEDLYKKIEVRGWQPVNYKHTQIQIAKFWSDMATLANVSALSL